MADDNPPKARQRDPIGPGSDNPPGMPEAEKDGDRMKAIIMAGGEGTRLRPLTSNRPKPMIPIINKPVIEHAVNLLRKQGISDIVISLFYRPENVQNYFGDGSEWDVNITYSIEESPLGTAGGVKMAAGNTRDTVVVLSGDGIIDFDIRKILDFHREKKSPFTIVLTRVSEPTEYGIVIAREDGRIDKFLEKPAWSEVFSDTVNTGMYVIEPHILDRFIPEDAAYDFSMDLFPILQERDVPLYGYVADGYWCDVGTLGSYRDVHRAILDGLVNIDFPGKKIGDNVWVGRNVEISPDSVIRGPVVLGNFVRVKPGAEISEFSVIGDNCVIDRGASVRRSIILHNTIIGSKSELRGAVIGKRCVIEAGVAIYEGAVVSDDCEVGSGSEIPPGIRVWPEKIIEQGTRLTADLVWGQTEKKMLFGTDGIFGSFNTRITPEFSTKLGSALGAFLGNNSIVVISRDTTAAARLIKRALTAGLLSMGVEVYDMEIESIPINRYSTRFISADMGIYVQISPMTGLQFVQIKIFDRLGFPISMTEEKKIENIFFRGDYPRKDAYEVGRLVYPIHHLESYMINARRYINHEVLQKKRFNLIVDCFNGATSYVFPDLLVGMGCSVSVLRGQIKESISEDELRIETRKALEAIVDMTRANREIGIIIGPHGEHLTIIDEHGNPLSQDETGALLAQYYMKYRGEKTINIPITSPSITEKIGHVYGATVVRTSTKIRSPQDATDIFQAGPSGRYPYLEMTYDPMIAALLLLELVALEDRPLYELRERLPRANTHSASLPCSVEEKASVMRMLSSMTLPEGARMEMTDGVKILRDNAWVLILPDAALPLIHFYADGDSVEARDAILDEFVLMVKKFKKG